MIQAPRRAPAQPRPLSIREFKGMDVTGSRDIRRAEEMVNMVLDDDGTPEMRPGYEDLFASSLGAGPILGLHRWTQIDGTRIRIVHHGTKLYKGQPLLNLVEIYSGMNGTNPSTSFELGQKLCIVDGTKFVVFDGTTAVDGETIAYVPTRYINRTPAGAGTLVEDFNLLQPKWKEYFTTVAGTLTYQLSDINLDSITSVKLNGVALTNPAGYTVNLTTGLVSLVSNPGNPAAGTTNNLEIILSKLRSGYASRIKKCTTSVIYGGPSDSRAFLSGNPDYPHFDWWTGLPYETGAYDPTYWPDTNYDRVGGDNDPIAGYAVSHDDMLVVKRNQIFRRTYEITTDAYGRTVMRFPTVPLYSTFGATARYSIRSVGNTPWFMANDGVYAVVSTDVRDREAIKKMSQLAGFKHPHPGPFADAHGQAIFLKGKYYLATEGDIVWVADTERTVKDEATGDYVPIWYKWTNIPVANWITDGENLYFGSNVDGRVYYFKNPAVHPNPYHDDGNLPISPCYWTMVMSTMDRDDMTKLVMSLIITAKPWTQSDMVVEYETEEGWFQVPLDEDLSLAFMDYSQVDYSSWSYLTTQNPQSFKVRIDNARGVQRFRVRIRSTGEADVFMGFASIDVNFQYLSGVR